MPTTDERREVAARLRNLDEQVLDCREYEHRAICAVVGCWGDGEYSDMELKDRLADSDVDGWFDEEKGPHGGIVYKPRFNFCPKCGSKVVEQ